MKTIGKYEIRGLLGRGGMSAVYKARLPVVGKLVALKLLAPHPHLSQLLGNAEIERRFIAEAKTMGKLRHPNLAELLDFDRHDGRPFFTMEYYCHNLGLVMGEGIRAEIPSRVLSLDRVLRYSRQMLLGLSRLHRAGVVHRDIKPFNLLITDQDQVKICDFGCSRLRGEFFKEHGGIVVGSPYYAAPEQERHPEDVDARADVYSAGVVIHRMLTGLLPGEREARPSEIHPDADTHWDDFVARALAQGREERFPSAQSMLEAVDDLEIRWARRKGELCSGLDLGMMDLGQTGAARPPLRSDPIKVGSAEACDSFSCDALGRPLMHFRHDFVYQPHLDTVFDRGTGLLWQRSGSPDPLEWTEAQAYIDALNSLNHGGVSCWRLPTVPELFTLLSPYSFSREDCVGAPFEMGKKRFWSADRRSFTAAWYVDAELGFAGWGDFTCRCDVRGVCRAKGKPV